MKEDIDILEKVIDTYNNWRELPYHFNKDIIQAISNLLLENKKLKEENKELKHITQNYNAYQQKSDNPNSTIIIADEKWFINGYFKENFIPKSKVKDKIEELKKKVEELTDEKGYWGGSDLLEQIKVLQELLEKRK